jgi:DNA repair exonuclease SbcCD ATPase subunit
MKLKIKNYRCYEFKEIDFGESGTVLLAGPSGKGKTTILSALMFCLYGKEPKTTGCVVELEFKDIHIKRMKKPSVRLLVTKDEITYENEAGQGIIDSYFGKTFNTIGYVPQTLLSTFVLMNSNDKLDFLEKFAFNNTDLGLIKTKVRAVIKEFNNDLLKKSASYETASEIFNKTKIPEEVKYPLKEKKSRESREKSMNNEIIRHKKALLERDRLLSALNNNREVIEKGKVSNAEYNGKMDMLTHLNKSILALTDELDSTPMYIGDEKLNELVEQLSLFLLNREMSALVKKHKDDTERLNMMKQEETEERDEEYANKAQKNWDKMSEKEVIDAIMYYEGMLSDAKKMDNLKMRLEMNGNKEVCVDKEIELVKKHKIELERLKKIQLAQKALACPVCKTSVHIHEDKLCVSGGGENENGDEEDEEEDVPKKIDVVMAKIDELNLYVSKHLQQNKEIKQIKQACIAIQASYDDELEPVSEITKSISDYKGYLSFNKELERVLREIKNREYSKTLLKFENDVKNQKVKIAELKKKAKEIPHIDEEETRLLITKERANKATIERLSAELKLLETKKSGIKISEFVDIQALERERETLQSSLEEVETALQDLNKNVENIKRFREYEAIMESIKIERDAVEELKNQEEQSRKRYEAVCILKQKINEAESISLINIINSINSHVQVYLDLFFPTDPMSARLSSKDEKAEIKINIEYKGIEMDIHMLSGGELSRVVLAYTLGLGEIFNIPLLLLDECTASLDQELTNVVIDGIKSNFTDKLVVMIVHQAVSGLFDRTITL